MRVGDESFERLRAALDELAVADAAEVLAEARVEARVRVRSMLSEALSHSMLEQVHEQLEPPPAPPRSERRRPRAAERETAGESAWYVYGVVAADAELDAHDVVVLREGPVAAAARRVSAEEFGEERLRAHLSDMEWVEATARDHEQTLEDIGEAATVVPMRMCTVYRSDDGVRELLQREREPLLEALEQLDGKREWGVKVFAAPPTLQETADAASGAAYMERVRRSHDRLEQVARELDEACAQIHERLCAAAVAGVVLAPQRQEASGHVGEMVLNGAYLVQDDAQDAFIEELGALDDAFGSLGLELVRTGPWPPYNFVPGPIGVAW